MRTVLLLFSLFLPLNACGLFHSVDPTPAMLAVEELNDEFQDTIDNFIALVKDLDIDPAKKAELLAILDQKDEKRIEVVKGLTDWLKSLGDLDWVEWGSRFYDKFQELRDKIKEGDA